MVVCSWMRKYTFVIKLFDAGKGGNIEKLNIAGDVFLLLWT